MAFGQDASDLVYENASEFQTLADVNGDGVPDLIVADKASGSFRIAEGQSDGSVVWRENVGNSGLTAMTGFSAGPLVDANRDQLIFSATLDNRIQIIDTPTDSRLSEPLRVPDTLVGPTLVTAINIRGGSFSSDYDEDFFDLAYHATLHDADVTNLLRIHRNDGSGLPFEAEASAAASEDIPSRPNRIEYSNSELPAYGLLIADGAHSFHLLSVDDGLDVELGSVSGLPNNAAYVYADFDGDGSSEFIFYQAGSSALYESQWTPSGLSALSTSSYSTEIAEIHVINSTGTPELFIIHAGRDQADRVTYTSPGGFAVQENFIASDGVFRGALSLSNSLHLLEGDATTHTSRQFDFGGSQHNFVASQELPLLPAAGATGATVLLFDSEPLRDPDARLLSRYNAGPWTSGFSLSAGGGAQLISESFQSASDGLGDAQAQTIQSAPAATAGGLTNQIAADNSIFFQDAAVGEVTSVLSVTPPGGTYDRALTPTFGFSGDASTIVYRTSTRIKNWTSITANPPLIVDDTTLYAVAYDGDLAFSNIVQVDYVITGAPDNRDSNGDGVPDFVALQHGLDPLASNNDADGDGFTNLQEILAGTDPTSASSKPSSRDEIAFEYPNSFDLQVAPAVPNPGAGSELLRPYVEAPETPMRLVVHQPDGVFLGAAPTQKISGLSVPAAPFEALDMVGKDLFVVTASSSTFKVYDGSAKDYGREVAGLIKTPALDFEGFDYSGFGDLGGFDDLAAETAAWRSAALDYFNALTRPNVLRDPVDAVATLELLLVESIIGQQLAARELSDRSNVTLTPFRQIENPLPALASGSAISDPIPNVERDRSVSITQLQALQRRDGSNPAFSVQGIIDTVRDELASASSPDIQQLKLLAERLYTNSATAEESGSLRQPLDALRRFIRQGNLANTGYEKSPVVADFPSTLLTEATQGVAAIVGSISPRTVETVTLYFAGDENASSSPVWSEVFYTHGNFDPESPSYTGTQYTLLDDQGDAYPVARAFPLTSGSVFQVSGYVLEDAPDGAQTLEVIPQPTLVFLRNQSPNDANGNLIPDSIEERNPEANLDAFTDSDDDGYSDLQEILAGSDPLGSTSIPMAGGSPAAVSDIQSPQLEIRSISGSQSIIEFDFAPDYAEHISFQLYSTEDLASGFNPTTQSAQHLGSGQHELIVDQTADQHFYIFRMQLK